MNVQDYISSGIIESYVLGLASDEESAAFEQLCNQYPELLKARNDFEIALENQAMQNAITPPGELKAKIFDNLPTFAKVVSVPASTVQQPSLVRKMNWLKYAAAACVALLAGSIYWNVSLYNKNKDIQTEYSNTIARLGDLQKDMKVLQENPTVKMAAMKGLEASPASFATVYWDTASHDVYLLANNLPTPPSDKQYQLWALLNGKPIDLGMLDYDLKEKKLLVRMKNADGAQAFAITLEKKEGDHTLPKGDMYVMGKL